jgi:hypothetical protein
MEYFESGKRLTRTQMREMYKNTLKRERATLERK